MALRLLNALTSWVAGTNMYGQRFTAIPSKQADFPGNTYRNSDEALEAARNYFQGKHGSVVSAGLAAGESSRLPGENSQLYVIGEGKRMDVQLIGQAGGGYKIGKISHSQN